ncbi:MAG: hypothetical protein JWR80_8006 [Bradyrhizobium sp.]|nr:hypothetical protein [Bradyrhizobium sp.]
MNDPSHPIAGRDYVPARGQRIPMPDRRPDWPLDGQPVDVIDAYQVRLVRDGDLILKPDVPAAKPGGNGGK